jgi:hypothetical protein
MAGVKANYGEIDWLLVHGTLYIGCLGKCKHDTPSKALFGTRVLVEISGG